MSSAEDKGRLYQLAMEAWRRGETTTALSKLDHLLEIEIHEQDHDPKSIEALRTLHEQVKADQAALKKAYDEARRRLAEGNSEEALSICEAQLGKYPEHPLFQSLKLDVEEHRRRRISSYIAEVDAAVQNEPDLEHRVEILETAADRYPDEQHFRTALNVVREKRDLVRNIVADAQIFEKNHQYAEALEQWRTLATIHPDNPGLEKEIERLTRLRDEFARTEGRRRLIDRARALMSDGAWERAVEVSRDAASHFPEDAEIAELEAAARQGASRATEARRLFEDGREAYAARRFEEGLRHLRNARALDPGNRQIREFFLQCLLDRAEEALESDWRAADRLLGEASELDPSSPRVTRINSAINGAREAEQVSWYLVRARRYQSEGREADARHTLEEGLSKFPDQASLIGLLAKLPSGEPAPAADLSPTREVSPAEMQPELEETRELPEAAPRADAQETREIAPADVTEFSGPAPAGKRSGPPRMIWVAGGMAGLLLIVAGAAAWLLGSKRISEPGQISLSVRTTPPGARISVDGDYRGESNLDLSLSPGSYVVEAHLEGYLPLRSGIEVTPESEGAVALSLEPLPVSLRIFSDLGDNAGALLDDEPLEKTDDDELVVEELDPGEHVLTVASRYSRASIAFAIEPGRTPRLTRPIEARETIAVAVGQFADSAIAYCSCAPVPLMIDGDFAGKLEPGGLRLQNLSYGLHELTFGESDDSRQVALDTGPAPSLSVFLQSDRNVGTLVVVADKEDDAMVVINGKAYPRTTRSGRLRIPGLAARRHRVAVTKEGFLPTPEQTVSIRKGRVTTARFDLEPVPQRKQLARLAIRDALGGATLSIDGEVKGTIPEHGSISLDVQPGERTIELSMETFRTRRIVRDFREGETVQLGLRDVALEQILGTLIIDLQPENAVLRLRRVAPVQQAARSANAGTVRVAPGTYEVQASLDGYSSFSKTVPVPSGETVELEVRLERQTPLLPPEPSMDGWDDPDAWGRQGELFVRRGGDYVTYGASPLAGVIEFTVHLQRGRRLRWFTNFIDEEQHALFEIDGSSFIRNIVEDGRSEQLAKVSHHRIRDDVYNVRIRISEHTIVHELRRGEEWITIDTWDDPTRDFRPGKFGFWIRGRNQIGVEHFSYTPR